MTHWISIYLEKKRHLRFGFSKVFQPFSNHFFGYRFCIVRLSPCFVKSIVHVIANKRASHMSSPQSGIHSSPLFEIFLLPTATIVEEFITLKCF